MTHIWAHRGSRLRAPGNTIPAYELTLESGADGIELDVHLTADVGTEASGPLPVPTLAEVVALLAPTTATLNIDIRNGPILYPEIEGALIAAHRASGMAERIVCSSFNHLTLVALREREPRVSIAPLYQEALVDPWGSRCAHGP